MYELSNLDILNPTIWNTVEKIPVAESFQMKQNEKRRILLQENETEDTEVIFWDESIKPEDVMEGEDLQAYYRSERNLYAKDTSSTDKEQQKKIKDISKLLKINPEDLTGYKAFFENNQDFSDGIPESVETSFRYIEDLIKNHPELQPDFDLWYKNLDRLATTDISSLTNNEFQQLASCPQSILNIVDKAHLHLFKVSKRDYIQKSRKSDTEPHQLNNVMNNVIYKS